MLLHEKKVFVGTFVPRKEREKEMGEKVELLFTIANWSIYILQVKKFTNVYVKNFGENQPEEKLEEVFSKFGKITSYKLVSISYFSPPVFISKNIQVKDRDMGEKEEKEDGGVEKSGDFKNKGFGFVSFQASKNFCWVAYSYTFAILWTEELNIISVLQDSESAQKAVEELNGVEMFGKTLYVSRYGFFVIILSQYNIWLPH